MIGLKQAIENYLVGISEYNAGEKCQLNIDGYAKELDDEISNYTKILNWNKSWVKFSQQVMYIVIGL